MEHSEAIEDRKGGRSAEDRKKKKRDGEKRREKMKLFASFQSLFFFFISDG